MRIKGTFLDEISHDIPHQNWGEAEWDRDFGYMREAGIDTVILIRCGYRRWQTFPSRVLTAEEGCYEPPVDLVDMFLRLSDKWGMNFWFGLYDSGKYWDRGEYEQEVALNKRVIDEVWSRYGHYKSFAGWYISQECSRNTGKIVDLYASLGRYCKEIFRRTNHYQNPLMSLFYFRQPVQCSRLRCRIRLLYGRAYLHLSILYSTHGNLRVYSSGLIRYYAQLSKS